MILWRMNSGCIEQLGKYRLKKDIIFKWLPVVTDGSLYCLCFIQSQSQLILLNLSKSTKLLKSDFMSGETGSFGFAVILSRQINVRRGLSSIRTSIIALKLAISFSSFWYRTKEKVLLYKTAKRKIWMNSSFWEKTKKFGTLHDFACHPCAGAMLISKLTSPEAP